MNLRYVKFLQGSALALFTIAFATSLSAQSIQGNLDPKTVQLDDGSEITLQTNYKVDLKQKVNPKPCLRKMAIFTINQTNQPLETTLKQLQTQLVAQISGEKIEILDPEDVVFAIAPLIEGQSTVEGTAQTLAREGLYKSIETFFDRPMGATAEGRNATRDEKLLANTSRTQLAEKMGADYVLLLSLDRFSKDTRQLKSAHLSGSIVNERYQLTATYKVVDTYSGTSLGGGTVTAQKTLRQAPGVEIVYSDLAGDLETALVEQLRGEILAKADTWREASLAKNGIAVEFIATACDINNQPIYLPKYDGDRKIMAENTPVAVLANVEIDGVVMGTTTCKIPLSAGLHTVRLVRPGYDAITFTLLPRENTSFAIPLRMSEGEYNRVKDTITFMHQLTEARELSQAEVQRIQGDAKRLEQSGIRIDAKEFPDVQYKSIY